MAQYVSGNVAVELGAEELEREDLLQEPGRRLTVLPGSRPQHSTQQAQTPLPALAVTAIKCVVASAAVLAVVSLVRIFIISVAFSFAAANATLTTQLDEARSLGSELEVQQSVYGSADRITTLATEVYGMVPADTVAVLDLSAAYAPAVSGEQTE